MVESCSRPCSDLSPRLTSVQVLIPGPVCVVLSVPAKPQDEKKDTFMEKLATQVIKNLQVKITSIHLRYEDDVSNRTPDGLGPGQ